MNRNALTPARVLQLAVGIWLIGVSVVCLRAFLHPDSHSVYPIFSQAGRDWLAGAELYGDADEEVADPVLPLQIHRARNDLLLVFQNDLDHLGRGGPRRVPRARTHQLRDLGAALGGTLRDRVDPLLGHQLGDWNAGDRRIARERHHRVAVAT